VERLTARIVLVGSPNSNPDMLYATGFMAPDPVVYLEVGRRKAMVVSRLEWGRALRTAAKRDIAVFTPQLLGLNGPNRGKLGEWVKAALEHFGANALCVPADFPHGIACELKHSRFKVKVIAAPPFPKRRVKQQDEIRHIRQAQRAAVIAMRSACALIKQSSIDADGVLRVRGHRLTSEAVQRRIEGILLEHDSFCGETIVACGRQSADPHERGHGPLKAHHPIVIDIFPKHLKHGYWGDITRTVVRGTPSPKLKRMYAAVKVAQATALKKVHPGVSCLAVHRAAAELFEKHGFETRREKDRAVGFIHSTGHGVGLAIHEAPSVGASRSRLRVGDVITIEPGLYYPDIGGIRIEDTIVVTEQGWRYLAPCEKFFECG
jgi:Xaa-Pro aminopeptidase